MKATWQKLLKIIFFRHRNWTLSKYFLFSYMNYSCWWYLSYFSLSLSEWRYLISINKYCVSANVLSRKTNTKSQGQSKSLVGCQPLFVPCDIQRHIHTDFPKIMTLESFRFITNESSCQVFGKIICMFFIDSTFKNVNRMNGIIYMRTMNGKEWQNFEKQQNWESNRRQCEGSVIRNTCVYSFWRWLKFKYDRYFPDTLLIWFTNADTLIWG